MGGLAVWQWIRSERGESREVFPAQCAVEDGDAADPAGEAGRCGRCGITRPMVEGAAGAVVGGRVEVVGRKPPREFQAQRGEITGSLGEGAVGAAAEGDLDAGVAEFTEFDPFVGGFAEDFCRDELILRRIVELVGRKRGVLAGLEAGLAVEAALAPSDEGGFDEGVGLGIFEPAIAGDAVEPAGQLVGRVGCRSSRSTAMKRRGRRRANRRGPRARWRRSWTYAARIC